MQLTVYTSVHLNMSANKMIPHHRRRHHHPLYQVSEAHQASH